MLMITDSIPVATGQFAHWALIIADVIDDLEMHDDPTGRDTRFALQDVLREMGEACS